MCMCVLFMCMYVCVSVCVCTCVLAHMCSNMEFRGQITGTDFLLSPCGS